MTPTRAAAAAAAEEDEGVPRPVVVKFNPVLFGLLFESGGGVAVINGKGRNTDPTVDGDEKADDDPDVVRLDGTSCCCCCDEVNDCDDEEGPGCDCCDSLNTSILFD